MLVFRFRVYRRRFSNSCENNIQHDREVWNFWRIRCDLFVRAGNLSHNTQVSAYMYA